MARIRTQGIDLEVRFKDGTPQEIIRNFRKFEDRLLRLGEDTFGRDALPLLEGRLKILNTSYIRGSQDAQRSLRSNYVDAANNRLRELRDQMTLSPEYIEWKKWAKKNRYAPYRSKPRASINRVGGGFGVDGKIELSLTGGLYKEIMAGMRNPASSKAFEFGNLMVAGEFRFITDTSVFPVRKGDNSGLSYVERLTNYLRGRRAGGRSGPRIIGDDESIMEFSDADWQRIALNMKRIIERRFLKPYAEFIDRVELK